MFKNTIFEEWLDKKSAEIILKLDKEHLSSEEMIILVLKAQSNHFTHLDIALREDMTQLHLRLNETTHALKEEMKRLGTRLFDALLALRQDMDKRFEQVDKRFERVYSVLKWQLGILFALFSGVYLKLFLG